MYIGTADIIFVPGAATSGLISKFGVEGPRELESFTSSPADAVDLKLPKETFPFALFNAARIVSPSVWDISNVGIISKESPKNVPDGFGAFVPPAKLWMIVATAPFSFAYAILSTNAMLPREIKATLPFTSIPW